MKHFSRRLLAMALDGGASTFFNIGGTGNNKFSPKGMFTREQAIVTLCRMM